MKHVHTHGQIPLVFAITLVILFAGTGTANAQSPVKGVYTVRYKATTGSSYTDTISTGSGLSGKYTYQFGTQTVMSNNYQRLDTFTVANGSGTSVFIFNNTVTPVIKFRRANNAWVTGRRRSVWFESDGNTPSSTVPVALRPAYDDSLESLFAKRLFNAGVDNAFENNTGTNNNNIERIDVIFPGGIKAFNPDSAGFTVFDRGAAGANDSFMIAAIKSVDVNGDPSDYYPAVRVGPANYGAAAGTTLSFHALRRDDTEPNLRLFLAAGSQAREGVFFSFRALGFPYSSGTSSKMVYGYSVMSTDVNIAAPGTPKNMVSYTNAAIFPTTTELGSVGGIDMVAVTGVAATLSTAGALLLPVMVKDFNARVSGDRVLIGWQLSEGNELREERIERCGNGVDFIPLFSNALLPATGIQQVVDEHPLNGQNFYRLRLVDMAGDVSYSPVVKLELVTTGAAPSMDIYPVPVRNQQFILDAFGLPAAGCLLEITDAGGHRVFQQALTGSRLSHLPVNLQGQLPAGIYTIRLSDKKGTGLLVKNVLLE